MTARCLSLVAWLVCIFPWMWLICWCVVSMCDGLPLAVHQFHLVIFRCKYWISAGTRSLLSGVFQTGIMSCVWTSGFVCVCVCIWALCIKWWPYKRAQEYLQKLKNSFAVISLTVCLRQWIVCTTPAVHFSAVKQKLSMLLIFQYIFPVSLPDLFFFFVLAVLNSRRKSRGVWVRETCSKARS